MKELNIKNLYYLLNLAFVILYIFSIFGIWEYSHHYLDELNEIYKIFISLSLIYFFNPWSKEKFNKFHKKIAFNAGLLLILTSSIAGIIKSIPVIRKIPYLQKILSVKKVIV